MEWDLWGLFIINSRLFSLLIAGVITATVLVDPPTVASARPIIWCSTYDTVSLETSIGEEKRRTNVDLGSFEPSMRGDEPPNHNQDHTGASVSKRKTSSILEMLTVRHRQHKSSSLVERSNRLECIQGNIRWAS